MVSIQTGLTLGLVGLAVVAFISLGGAGGIGSRIGGGFRTFGESLVAGISGTVVNALNPFADKGGNEPAIIPEPTCGTGTKENIFGQCVPAEITTQPSIIPSLFFAPAFAEPAPAPIPTRIGPIPSLFFAPAPPPTTITQISPTTIIGAGAGGFSATREQLGL